MSATMKDIARMAEVNISTVSRALNNSSLISQETKDRILAIAGRMDYFPNSLARGLVIRKSETIGIILPKIFFLQGYFFSEVLRGIEKVSIKNGYNILIASTTGKKQEKNFPFNLVRAKRIDGMLIINEQQKIRNLSKLKRESVPFVFINRYLKASEINCLASDNIQGGKLATSHLIELGHKRIGVISGSFKFAVSNERLKGYKLALKNHNIPFDNKLVQEGLFEKAVESGIKCTANLLELNKPPTAIFAFSDEMAMGVMQAIRRKGLRIPQDIAVVGYDNIEYGSHLNPPLTTISQNPFAIGTASCQMLIDILNNKRIKNNHVHIPVKLIARESCGSKLNN